MDYSLRPGQRFAITDNKETGGAELVKIEKRTGLSRIRGKWKVICPVNISSKDVNPSVLNLANKISQLDPVIRLSVMAHMERSNEFQHKLSKNPEASDSLKTIWQSQFNALKAGMLNQFDLKPKDGMRLENAKQILTYSLSEAIENKSDISNFKTLFEMTLPLLDDNDKFLFCQKCFNAGANYIDEAKSLVADLGSKSIYSILQNGCLENNETKVSACFIAACRKYGHDNQKIEEIVKNFGSIEDVSKKIIEVLSNSQETPTFEDLLNTIDERSRYLYVNNLCNISVSPEATLKCQKIYDSTQLKNPVPQLSQHKLEWDQTIVEARVQASGTITKSTEQTTASDNWKFCEEKARAKAAEHKLNNTPYTNREVANEFNGLLAMNLKNNDGKPGELRTNEIRTEDGLYVPLSCLGDAMESFEKWLNKEIDECIAGNRNPIIIAAQAYQKLVSIHPYSDANGRTTRMVMDYILMRFDLPPASLGKDVRVAIFSDNLYENPTPSDAVDLVAEGVVNTYSLLGVTL